MQNNLHDDDIDAMWQITDSFSSLAWTRQKAPRAARPADLDGMPDTCVSDDYRASSSSCFVILWFQHVYENVMIQVCKYFPYMRGEVGWKLFKI